MVHSKVPVTALFVAVFCLVSGEQQEIISLLRHLVHVLTIPAHELLFPYQYLEVNTGWISEMGLHSFELNLISLGLTFALDVIATLLSGRCSST